MEKSDQTHEISKGLETKTVMILRERLKNAYNENKPYFT